MDYIDNRIVKYNMYSCWDRDMKTLLALLALCEGTGHIWILTLKSPIMRSFDNSLLLISTSSWIKSQVIGHKHSQTLVVGKDLIFPTQFQGHSDFHSFHNASCVEAKTLLIKPVGCVTSQVYCRKIAFVIDISLMISKWHSLSNKL